jgi:hypothetical protein
MLSRGCAFNPPSQRDSNTISWSTTPKLFYLPTSCGSCRQWSNTTKAYPKIADELTSMDLKKLVALPSPSQQGT